MVSVVVVVVLDELGIEELLDDDGVLLDEDEDGMLELLELLSDPLALPLMELEELGGVELLLDELGDVEVVVSVVLLVVELGEDGVALVVDGVVVVVVLLVPVLLRSQPVTAAVATASTATKGMSLFMTSPFECGWWGCQTIPSRGARRLGFNEEVHAQHVPARSPLKARGRQAIPFRDRGRFSGSGGKGLPERVGRTPTGIPPT